MFSTSSWSWEARRNLKTDLKISSGVTRQLAPPSLEPKALNTNVFHTVSAARSKTHSRNRFEGFFRRDSPAPALVSFLSLKHSDRGEEYHVRKEPWCALGDEMTLLFTRSLKAGRTAELQR